MKRTNIQAFILFLTIGFILSVFPVHGQQENVDQEERKELSSDEKRINPLDLINDHMGDHYYWSLFGLEKKALTIPLVVIVHSNDTGWSVFRSTRLWDGAEYDGYYIASEGRYEGKVVRKNSAGEEVRPFDLSFTKNAFALVLSGAILVLFLFSLKRSYRKNPLKMPGRLKGIVEMTITMLVDEVIKPCIGKEYRHYTPYLLTLFFFILTINLLGLIVVFPGGVNLSGNVSVCLVLAASTLVITLFSGTRAYWKEIFWPDVPVWLNAPIPILTIIELFGILSKPFALMVRMFANLFGGHVIGIVLVSLIFIFAPLGAAYAGISSVFVVAFSVFMLMIEVLVCFIQAYVFFMLSSLFIGLTKVEH